MKYLKEKQDYINRYDRVTVEKCRWAEKSIDADFVAKYVKEGKDRYCLYAFGG